MHWGVATALLEQSGDEGLFELDEAWLPRVAPQPAPPPAGPRQPLPRPARPLRRAGATRGRMGGAGGLAGGLVRVRAQRRRPADRGPRPRPRAPPAARGHLLRDRGRLARRSPSSSTPTTPSTAAAAARPTSYDRAFVGHLGHYTCPNCGADRPAPDIAATEDRAARDLAARACSSPRPRASSSSSSPSPASTTSTTPWRRWPRACAPASRWSRSARASSPCARSSAASRRSRSSGKPVSILLIKNPAGANEVLRTLTPRVSRRRDRPLARAQRPDRRRPRRLLDLGCGLRASRRTVSAG